MARPHPRLVAVLVGLAVPCVSYAQTRRDYQFFHGSKYGVRSGLVSPGDNGALRRDAAQTLKLSLPAGAKVCVTVVNAHAVNYAYSLSFTIDSTAPALPDLSKDSSSPLAKLFAGAVAAKKAADASGKFDQDPSVDQAAREFKGDLSPVLEYVDRVGTLRADVESAKEFAKNSDSPERLDQVEDAGDEIDLERGFKYARYRILHLSKESGHFNDAKLKETLAAWLKEVQGKVGSDTKLKSLVSMIDGYATSLVGTRDQLLKGYTDGTGQVEVCGTVADNTTTFELKIAKKDSSAAKERDTGADVQLKFIVENSYVRPPVSVHPIALGVLTSNITNFSLDQGGILRASDQRGSFDIRLGALFEVNVAEFGERHRLGLGAAIGAATGGAEQALSDAFFAVVVSFMDKARVGVGIGGSWVATSVKGGSVDQPLDLKGKKLDDLIERSPKTSLYLTFLFPKLPF